MVNEPAREMTLDEYVAQLPPSHRAAKELAALRDREERLPTTAALEAQRWIPVGERLPEPIGTNGMSADVLVSSQWYAITIARYGFEAGEWFGSEDDLKCEDITHWQPLLTPPTSEVTP